VSIAETPQTLVRRLVAHTLLFALVVVAGIGLSGLLGRLIDPREVVVAGDNTGLAQSLAFALIGGPLALIMWWVLWSRLSDTRERSSFAWWFYLEAMTTVSLITFVSAASSAAASAIDSQFLPRELAAAFVWAVIWVWHRWMAAHPTKGPHTVAPLSGVLCSVYGLVIAVGGTIGALQGLFDEAVRDLAGQFTIGDPWWIPAVQSLVWALAGGIVLWGLWVRSGVRSSDAALTGVALVVVGVLGSAILTLTGTAWTLYVVLRVLFDPSDPVTEILSPLGGAVASALIGAVVFIVVRLAVAERAVAVREGSRLVTAGVALIGAASGLGVMVNATLAAVAAPLVSSDLRSLLLGGLSALLVGAPAWWWMWRRHIADAPATGRKVYLVAIFGVSAVVALITLLVISFRLFEFVLDETSGTSLIDRVRAPLGLLIATGLVAGYHFAIWRRDRAAELAAAPPAAAGTQPASASSGSPSSVQHAFVVVNGNGRALSNQIRELTGATVTILPRAPLPGASAGSTATPGGSTLAVALAAVTTPRVLIIVGPNAEWEIIPLL
jgi:hypothetical protein